MAKSAVPLSPEELDQLRAGFEKYAAESRAFFGQPRFSTRVVLDHTGITSTRLTNWLTEKTFDLDADRHRAGKTTARLFSARDEVILGTASFVLDCGLPLHVAKALAIEAAEEVSKRFMPQASVNGAVRTVFPVGDDYAIVREWELIAAADRPVRARVFSQGRWHERQIPAAAMPPGRFVFDLLACAERICSRAGVPLMRPASKR